MEPLAAIGLASGIITFIDFSWNIVSGTIEVYQSCTGVTKENARIGTIIEDLREYADQLISDGASNSKQERALQRLAAQCSEVSEELIQKLEKLKAKENNSKWHSFKATWASMRKEKKIATIERRLCGYRAQINQRLLALLCENQSNIRTQLDVIQHEAEKLSSKSVQAIKLLRQEIVTMLSSLNGQSARCDSSSSGEDDGMDEEEQTSLFKSLRHINTKLAKLEAVASRVPRETRVLQHLYFNHMSSRKYNIDKPAAESFSWILQDDKAFQKYCDSEEGISLQELHGYVAKMDESRKLLTNWLEDGSEAFHISGKPGSGKSTLMKLICEDPRTMEYLKRWSGSRNLALASFFFWNQGNDELQKSLGGLYRAILFSILKECPQLIPEIFPQQWEKLSTVSADLVYETGLFSPPKIKQAFELLMRGSSPKLSNFCFCLFIDGLDEYQGSTYDRREFAQQLRDWARMPNIKICVSSREHLEFMYVFSPQLRIQLQDVTRLDIYRVSCFFFRKAECYNLLSGIYLELTREILRMAQGVFFWAVLVVKSIINEAFVDSDPQKLRQKLQDTPEELDELYDQILGSLDRADRKWADLALLLALKNPFNHEMNAMCLGWLDNIDNIKRQNVPSKNVQYAPGEVGQRLEDINKALLARTKGLLVLHKESVDCPEKVWHYSFFSTRVHFFHRTVRDYLENTTRRSRMEAQYPNFDFSLTHSLLRLAEVSSFDPLVAIEEHTGGRIVDLDFLKDNLEMYAMEAYVLKSPSIEKLRPYYLQRLRERGIFNNLWMTPRKDRSSLRSTNLARVGTP
ncbi:hypothetical protein F5B20DRAFT_575956 [Whalleya microplaca]|nr:hypothetical protein F5B20DRAFT_575956 [Whalleya microplaca]